MADDTSDLSKLSDLNTEGILQVLKQRFKHNHLYTYIGDVLIAINPYVEVPNTYTEKLLAHYQTERNPPHIYWTAEQSYKRLCYEQASQCIIVTGDSGAGKTENTKHVLHYLVNRSSCGVKTLTYKLNNVNPLIEFFGNACTALNKNSSRFGKLLELSYQANGELLGGTLRTFVFEKSRIAHHRFNEKTFHVFYGLFAGMLEQDLLKDFQLERPQEYRILVGDAMPHLHHAVFESPEEKSEYRTMFIDCRNILKKIEFTENDIVKIFQVLAACLHLGNIEYEEVEDRPNGVEIRDDIHLKNALYLLGLENNEENIDDMNESLISRPIVVHGQTVQKPFNQVQADDVRDSIIKALYAGIFRGVIDQINKSIEGNFMSSRTRKLSIGILDISGFECFEENSLEQLFINITNEQIQQFHQQQIFELENKEYLKEDIHVSPNKFQDNTPLLELVYESPGILSLLDDHMKMSSSKDDYLVHALNEQFGSKSHVYEQGKSNIEFKIQHYTGQVTYCARHFLAKNRGTIPEQIKEILIERSDNYFVNSYFDVPETFSIQRNRCLLRNSLSRQKARQICDRYNETTKLSGDRQGSKSATSSEASQFRKSLTSLMDTLSCCKPLFIRCIKPNSTKKALYFNDPFVLNQLNSAGIGDVTRIRQNGYQIRISFDQFFKICKTIGEYLHIQETDNVQQNVKHIMNLVCNEDKHAYQIGNTKVFLKGYVMEQINRKTGELIKKKEESERIKRQIEQAEESVNLKDEAPSDMKRRVSIQEPPLSDDMNSETYSAGSYPPTYSDVENENKRNTTERLAWDAFRNTERDYEGCVELEGCFLKFSRLVMCVSLFLIISLHGACNILIPLLKVSQLSSTQKDLDKKSVVVTELIVCFVTPVALTFCQSVSKICLGRVKSIGWKYYIPVLIFESMEVCGTSYLLLKILPDHSTCFGITLVMLTFSLPSVLNIRKHFALAKYRRKFIQRFLSASIAIIAMIIQLGALICVVSKPEVVFNEGTNKHFESKEIVLLAVSLVAISLGYIQNFLTSDIQFGPLCIKILDFKIAIEKARPKINVSVCIIKVGIFLSMARILLPNVKWTFSTSATGGSYTPYEVAFINFLNDHVLMLLYVYSVICTSYAGLLACKLQMQRIAFYLPLVLVPVGCIGIVIGLCDHGTSNILDGMLVCPDMKLSDMGIWIGITISLWLSLILLTWHVLFPKCHRMERAERLFVLPTRDNFFSAFAVLFGRKDDVIEQQMIKHAKFRSKEESKTKDGDVPDNERKSKIKQRPYVYVCGTMWHETRNEMLQLLKSLFRLDFHRSKYKLAESKFDVKVDYFEMEIHIIFDDAFYTEDKSHQRLPNEWVQQLVNCIEEASTSVAKGHIKWDIQPIKTTTPYGGRLSWIMPGGTEMVFHLKDKEKIRHRKRWSQIFYMYYLLGYKLLGTATEDSMLHQVTNKNYHYRRMTSILNQIPTDKIKTAHHSFILTLDGDVDFKADAVQKMLDKLTKNDKVGAVCGRVHPIGTGPVVWYQQFEYAVGHWLQKATENVFGCVLCCPGAFSMFRATALMDDNVMKMYTSEPTEPGHFIKYEQGEDRWLCTLLLQQGWKIDYAASADAFTYAPETFKDFFVQRRRWSPSTLANIVDLLSSWRVTTKVNDNISTLFVFYLFVLLGTSLLGIGTVTLMITGAFNAVLGTTMVQSYVIVLVPIALYAVICIKCSNDRQIQTAALLGTIYTVVMVIVTVGLFVIFATEKLYSPNIIFFIQIIATFLFAGIAHPKELMCLVHGLIYYLMVPTTFIFLTVYYMCNIHVVSWGTREKKPDKEENDIYGNSGRNQPKKPLLVRCLDKLGIINLFKECTKMLKQVIGKHIATGPDQTLELDEMQTMGSRIHLTSSNNVINQRRIVTRHDPDAWQDMPYFGKKEKETISEDENEFWRHLLQKYLQPVQKDEKKALDLENGLKTLRNNVAFGFLMLNFLFATAVFQIQNNEHQLKSLYILDEYEPLSVVFLCIFSLILLIQFVGMIVHRWGTLLHLISSVRLLSFSKSSEQKWTILALKEAEKLQSADPNDGELGNLSDISEEVEPDYPDEDIAPDYDNDMEPPRNSINTTVPRTEYERMFLNRFETNSRSFWRNRHNLQHQMTKSQNQEINRFNLYQKTLGKRTGRHVQNVRHNDRNV